MSKAIKTYYSSPHQKKKTSSAYFKTNHFLSLHNIVIKYKYFDSQIILISSTIFIKYTHFLLKLIHIVINEPSILPSTQTSLSAPSPSLRSAPLQMFSKSVLIQNTFNFYMIKNVLTFCSFFNDSQLGNQFQAARFFSF